MVEHKLFGYGTDGDDDNGWGCVYRSVQNIMEFNGYRPVLSLQDTVKNMEREWNNWAEPADASKIFPNTKGFYVGKTTRLFKFTS